MLGVISGKLVGKIRHDYYKQCPLAIWGELNEFRHFVTEQCAIQIIYYCKFLIKKIYHLIMRS